MVHIKGTKSIAEQQLIVLTMKVKCCFLVYLLLALATLKLQMSLRHLLVVQAILSLAQNHEQASASYRRIITDHKTLDITTLAIYLYPQFY